MFSGIIIMYIIIILSISLSYLFRNNFMIISSLVWSIFTSLLTAPTSLPRDRPPDRDGNGDLLIFHMSFGSLDGYLLISWLESRVIPAYSRHSKTHFTCKTIIVTVITHYQHSLGVQRSRN